MKKNYTNYEATMATLGELYLLLNRPDGLVFTTREIIRDIGDSLGVNASSVYKYLNRLIADGTIERVHRGVYRLPPRPGSTTDAL